MITISAKDAAITVSVVGYVGTAVVSTMPPKDSEWNGKTVYAWLFDCAHMLLNSRPTRDAEK